MKEKTMDTLPALQRVNEVGIPTKKLNTVQQKNYREYAQRVYDNVEKMLKEIRVSILNNLRNDTTIAAKKEIVKDNPEIIELMKEVKALQKSAETVTNESYKIMSDYENKKAKLTAEMESKIANLKNDKMLPIVEQFKNLQDKSRALTNSNKNIYNGLSGDSVRITTDRKYYEDDEDETEGFGMLAVKRNIEISYPSIKILEKSESSFINPTVLEEKVDGKMAPAIEEFNIAEVKLESMGQAVAEVMMFDEDRMNEAFTKLFAFRDDIQQKHLQIVRKINFNLNEGVE